MNDVSAFHLDDAPEVFSHLAGIVCEVFLAYGLDDTTAGSAAWDVVARFKADFRGQQIYIPKEHLADLAVRNAAIYEAWRQGEKPSVLARRYHLSLQTVRAAISEHKSRDEQQTPGVTARSV